MGYDSEYDADRLDSDDLEAFLEQSRSQQGRSALGEGEVGGGGDDDDVMIIEDMPTRPATIKRAPPNALAGPSKVTMNDLANPLSTTTNHSVTQSASYLDRQQAVKARIAGIESEISTYDDEIQKLHELKVLRTGEKKQLERELEGLRRESLGGGHGATGKGKQVANDCVDYHSDDFQWLPQLKATMKRVFSIDTFRLCQQGTCNANVDGRDIVCIMPTGGGKSLTYQLPALLTPGCTIVISPLIALIMDQVLHLREAGVNAAMLSSATHKEETNDVYAQLRALADGRLTQTEIKILYVTPERVAKTKRLLSILDKLYAADKLARFVIDEAHCVSQMGHSFRPDYRNLHVLRQMYPRVPIIALSATCPPRVLDDVLKILKMKPIVDGRCANLNEGTVYFSSPLYRPNLHYKVLAKPSSSSSILKAMVDLILAEHKDESGIVYCLSKKDSEEVAKGLEEHKIRSGVYHADVSDSEKESLHRRWRDGKVKVVCATIAFGLGIDKGDVRFVVHHSMSKTLEAFYQESGRAGRDGKDADCVLFYRPQDAMRLSSLICTDMDGQSKLYNMLQFAQNMTECRKVMFAKCFSHTSQLSMSSWATEDIDALTPCGHCDNCVRQKDTFEEKDVTEPAWQITKVASEVGRGGGRITMSGLADLVRGIGKGTFDVRGGGRGRRKKDPEQVEVDLEEVAGGKVALSKDDTERLIIELLVSGYLTEEYHSTAYQTNVYLKAGPRAIRLTRMSKEQLAALTIDRILCSFVKHTKRTRKSSSGTAKEKDTAVAASTSMSSSTKATSGRKRVSRGKDSEDDEDEDEGHDVDEIADFIVDDDDDDRPPLRNANGASSRKRLSSIYAADPSSSDDEDQDQGWGYSMRQSSSKISKPPLKLRKLNGPPSDPDIVILSSD